MKDQTLHQATTAANVLALPRKDVPRFLRRSLRERTLRSVITELNKAVLSGAEQDRADARRALAHLGFI
jgi:hypothetical protein